jgi:hypothetical protein
LTVVPPQAQEQQHLIAAKIVELVDENGSVGAQGGDTEFVREELLDQRDFSFLKAARLFIQSLNK